MVFYKSTKILFDNQNPYIVSNNFTQINYLPSTLFFLYPILIFNFTDSSRIWLIFSIVSLLGSFYLLYKIK
ncbi:MAG: hypothetical protein M1268_01835, partial [Patescibacteria group bacterium]|nr:hypothetical protein [Patescibacteria group bacterium]